MNFVCNTGDLAANSQVRSKIVIKTRVYDDFVFVFILHNLESGHKLLAPLIKMGKRLLKCLSFHLAKAYLLEKTLTINP